MNTQNKSATADREIVTTRVFDAPRETVWQAWTDPDIIGKWWGPKGFACTIHEMDVKPNGKWILTMHGPDGTDYHNTITYLEVQKPEKLVLRYVSPPPPFDVTTTFTDLGGKTSMTFRMLFGSVDECNRVKVFAIEGNEQTFDRLADILAAKRN